MLRGFEPPSTPKHRHKTQLSWWQNQALIISGCPRAAVEELLVTAVGGSHSNLAQEVTIRDFAGGRSKAKGQSRVSRRLVRQEDVPGVRTDAGHRARLGNSCLAGGLAAFGAASRPPFTGVAPQED